MPKLFNTKLEERVLACKPEEDLGPLLVEFWNNKEKYDIIWADEGSTRKEHDAYGGNMLFANKYFRVVARLNFPPEQKKRGEEKIPSCQYQFIRDGGDLFTTILVEINSNKES